MNARGCLGLLIGLCCSTCAAWAAGAQEFRYDARGRRDPFEALVTPAGELRTPRSGGATGALHVEGVLWDPTQPLAIVNGEVHRVGDEVEGFKIMEIRAAAIVVSGVETNRLVIPVMAEGVGSAP